VYRGWNRTSGLDDDLFLAEVFAEIFRQFDTVLHHAVHSDGGGDTWAAFSQSSTRSAFSWKLLSEVDREFSEYVVKPAFEAGAPLDRVRKIARRLREFYKSGQQSCLLDTVTLADSPSTREHARRSMEFWIDAFTRLGRDAGLSPAIARRRSQEAVTAIEGGLVVSRCPWKPPTIPALPRKSSKAIDRGAFRES
jgi:hypothetical protein